MELDKRETQVLATIIEKYVARAKPVGSRMVSRASGLSLSPATMRNTMADLTDKGFLSQPHTSAGRVPTARAFRFYVNHVLTEPPRLSEEEKGRILSMLEGHDAEITGLLRQVGRLLSQASSQAGMVIGPSHTEVRWKHIGFVPIKPGMVLAILVLQGGIVQEKLVHVDPEITSDELMRYANYLNDLFQDHTVSSVRQKLAVELAENEKRLEGLYQRSLFLLRQIFETESRREVYVDGASNVLSQPEFTDLDNMRALLDLLEERSRILDLLDKVVDEDGVSITMGGDQAGAEPGFSLVATPYAISGQTLGFIGVIGPIRMNYSRILPVVDYTARVLTQMLQKRF
jgi:heat-inducible transcriptional repressor